MNSAKTQYRKPVLIAEIGCNHKGDFNLAKEFILTAKNFCQITHVKFQKRTNRELLTDEEYNSPHPNPENAYGKTYGEHREFLEFTLDQHRELKNFCEENGMVYSTSIWDFGSLRDIVSLNPEFIKIPSATNTHFDLLDELCKTYKGQIQLSLGMTTRAEERKIVQFFEERGRAKDLVLYACTSGYPVPPDDICLLEISRLVSEYGDRVGAIGFSGHHNGISVDMGAYALGANYIERHFTLDRTWKGTDHAASLEPDGLRRLQRDLINLHKALTFKNQELLAIEEPTRRKLKWDRAKHAGKPAQAPKPESTESIFNRIKLVLMDVDGVLTDSGMYYSQEGDELKKFNTRDGHAIHLLRDHGIKTGFLTRENTEIVNRRAKKLGVDFLMQGAKEKLVVLNGLLKEQGLDASEVCYIGDDINDLEVLRNVGIAAVPNDAMSSCKAEADYVCKLRGGEGCVREVADWLLRSRDAN